MKDIIFKFTKENLYDKFVEEVISDIKEQIEGDAMKGEIQETDESITIYINKNFK